MPAPNYVGAATPRTGRPHAGATETLTTTRSRERNSVLVTATRNGQFTAGAPAILAPNRPEYRLHQPAPRLRPAAPHPSDLSDTTGARRSYQTAPRHVEALWRAGGALLARCWRGQFLLAVTRTHMERFAATVKPIVKEDLMERMLNVQDVADELGTPVRFVRRLITERRIRFHKIGKYVRISSTDLYAFIAAGAIEPEAPTGSARRIA